LQHLQHRLLDESIQHRGDAQLSHSSVRLGDFNPPHRLRLVGPVQKLYSDGWPVLFQVRDTADGHPIDARTTVVGLHPLYCVLQILSFNDFLHQSVGARWAVGSIHRGVGAWLDSEVAARPVPSLVTD
jgi:hypothetical protein